MSDVLLVAWGLGVLIIGLVVQQPGLMLMGAGMVGLPGAVRFDSHRERKPKKPKPMKSDAYVGSLYKTGGGVHGRGKAPKYPPRPAAIRPPQPEPQCNRCGQQIDQHTGGWCSSCESYAAQRPMRPLIARTSTDSVTCSDALRSPTRRFRGMP